MIHLSAYVVNGSNLFSPITAFSRFRTKAGGLPEAPESDVSITLKRGQGNRDSVN